MKRLWIIPVILMFMGCMGVMNEFDRDAAVAHSQAQQEFLKAWIGIQGKPLCKFDIPAGKEFPGIKAECAAPVSMAGMPKLDQYVQPKHPADAVASGTGSLLTQLPMAILGMFGFDRLADAAKNAGGVHTTNTISGQGNTIKAAGQTNISGIYTGSQVGGMIDGTTPAQVVNPVIVTQPPPLVVNPVIVP